MTKCAMCASHIDYKLRHDISLTRQGNSGSITTIYHVCDDCLLHTRKFFNRRIASVQLRDGQTV